VLTGALYRKRSSLNRPLHSLVPRVYAFAVGMQVPR
jgi:hypothetical protein